VVKEISLAEGLFPRGSGEACPADMRARSLVCACIALCSLTVVGYILTLCGPAESPEPLPFDRRAWQASSSLSKSGERYRMRLAALRIAARLRNRSDALAVLGRPTEQVNDQDRVRPEPLEGSRYDHAFAAPEEFWYEIAEDSDTSTWRYYLIVRMRSDGTVADAYLGLL
jgi:hypothetical protein